ncbi:thiamine pyrophosphokinase 1 [Colletotrichum chrysophilum]|uniref:Thiamine pyrophosphokinase n=1 Tax=Colletotrichum chrysophilum TaxID=1836956 RepID=A0AAD9EA24_9PEZI|nr:thiamine pyrophosphokinase 1 [Colletotrichum chrysophilum]
MPRTFNWHPATLVGGGNLSLKNPNDYALVVLNQPVSNNRAFFELWNNASVRVAADGGANRLHELFSLERVQAAGLDAIVGDLDSLEDTAKEFFQGHGKRIPVVHFTDQNTYDIDKVVSWLRSAYSQNFDIVLYGGIGGRVDHGLRQIHYLFFLQPEFDYSTGKIFLASQDSLTFLMKPGRHVVSMRRDIGGCLGDTIGLIPVASESIVSTKGLEKDVSEVKIGFHGSIMSSCRILQEQQELEVLTTEQILFTVSLE